MKSPSSPRGAAAFAAWFAWFACALALASCSFHLGTRYSIIDGDGPVTASPDPDVLDDSDVEAGAVASRTSGVAPLYVHFNVNYSGDVDTDRDFSNCEYIWSFGDAGSGTWGTNGTSKNKARGAVAAHVYETPGTYTAHLAVHRNGQTVSASTFTITVENPDVVYAGTATVCVADTAHSDFAGAPTGSRQVTTNDLSNIAQFAAPGTRILFHRGSSWTSGTLAFPNGAGPVTLGAYGAGTGADALGIYSNAPRIAINGATFFDMSQKQDWRVMDINFTDSTGANRNASGASDMQRFLFLRIRAEGFYVGLGWGHYNDSNPIPIDQMAVVSCESLDSEDYGMYVGSERLAFMGNIVRNANVSHVVRVWQAYKSVISNNTLSGASLTSGTGRHALKLHGPGDSEYNNGALTPRTIELAKQTRFLVISGNTFGSSGPWPVAIGPQDAGANEALSDILFERNRLISSFGSQSSTPVQISLMLWARNVTVRNNIFDGTASSGDYTAMQINRRGVEPAPAGVEVYNNTIYRRDNGASSIRAGIDVGAPASGTVVRNNLAAFPGAGSSATAVRNASSDLTQSNNLLLGAPGFIDPNNSDPLLRNFNLAAGSAPINVGAAVPVFEDFAGNARPNGEYDVGAFEN
jgi:hypothetical protein